MKEARITKLSRHHNRQPGKLKKASVKPVTIVDRNEADIAIIDLVLKALYFNSHIDILHVEDDIYKSVKLNLPYVESERLWEVMLSSGLVNPVAGFGNAGKLKLSRTGYQLMAQFGGYREYMSSLQNPAQPHIIIEAGPESPAETDLQEVGGKDKGK